MTLGRLRSVLVVVVVAAVQAALAPLATTPGWPAATVALAVVSFAVAVVGLWTVSVLAARGPRPATARGLALTALLVLVLVAVGVLVPFALPLVAVPMAAVLAGAVTGPGGPLRAAGRAVAAVPLRAVLTALATVVLVALAWAAAAVIGLFLPDWWGYAATWVVFGLVAVVVVRLWVQLGLRAQHWKRRGELSA